jgi:hypothetical protein
VLRRFSPMRDVFNYLKDLALQNLDFVGNS